MPRLETRPAGASLVAATRQHCADPRRWFGRVGLVRCEPAGGAESAGSNKDKQQVVTRLLEDAEWRQWSDREIARHCGVTDKTVAKYRHDLSASSEFPKIETRLVERNGSVYAMQTAQIGIREHVCDLSEDGRGADLRMLRRMAARQYSTFSTQQAEGGRMSQHGVPVPTLLTQFLRYSCAMTF